MRKAAAEAILILTGAKDKETLLQFLESHGITGGIYSSKEDEVIYRWMDELGLYVLLKRFSAISAP